MLTCLAKPGKIPNVSHYSCTYVSDTCHIYVWTYVSCATYRLAHMSRICLYIKVTCVTCLLVHMWQVSLVCLYKCDRCYLYAFTYVTSATYWLAHMSCIYACTYKGHMSRIYLYIEVTCVTCMLVHVWQVSLVCLYICDKCHKYAAHMGKVWDINSRAESYIFNLFLLYRCLKENIVNYFNLIQLI